MASKDAKSKTLGEQVTRLTSFRSVPDALSPLVIDCPLHTCLAQHRCFLPLSSCSSASHMQGKVENWKEASISDQLGVFVQITDTTNAAREYIAGALVSGPCCCKSGLSHTRYCALATAAKWCY